MDKVRRPVMMKTMVLILVAFVLIANQSIVQANIFDISALSYQTVVVRAGNSVNLSCPGTSELSLVSTLEWRCIGCSSTNLTSSSPPPPSSSSGGRMTSNNGVNSGGDSSGGTSSIKLVEYAGNGAVVVWTNRERMSLDPLNYALQFFPVKNTDQGEYTCLVNERRRPEAIVHLIVQDVPDPPGRPLIMGFTSRSVNLSWAPSLSSHGVAVSHYVIHTRVGEEGDWEVHNALTTPNNGTSIQVIGLLPYTVYSFRVVSVNGLGPSLPSRESYYMVTLREVPDGKPTVTAAHNSSSTSIYLSWKPPPRSSLHGEFLGYRLAYRQRNDETAGSDSVQEIFLRDPSIENHVLQGLQTFTQYSVSLQVFNPEGLGPSTTVIIMTDEGAPGKPVNVSIGDVNDSSIALSWAEPENPNGIIKGYRIYFMRKNFTDVQTVRSGDRTQKFVLTDLEPYTEYKLWLKAFTWKHEGEPSEPVVVQTDVRGPSPPRIANLTCHNADTLFLQWHRPSIYNKSIDLYYIYYRREDEWDFEELAVATTTDRLDHMMFLPNLTTKTMYEVKIRGATRSLFSPAKIYPGLFSESRKIIVDHDCDRLSSPLGAGDDSYSIGPEIELSAGMVAALVCACFALILVLLAFVLWRKYFQAAYYYLDDGPPTTPPLNQPTWDGGEPPTHNNLTIMIDDDSDFTDGKNKEYGVNAKGPIPVPLFPQHVATLHADGDIGFSKEYEAIQSVSFQGELNSEHSMNEDNKNKNRYLNIVAYDHSRVQLRPLPGQKKSTDYINANYIDGFQQCRGYIGTQGPLPSTFDAFWRMIWEQRVAVIVMITNLVERGRRKCDMYWPKDGVETYGCIQVKLISEDVRATYTIRTFTIKHLKKKKSQSAERTVLQFHYTNWPDHGTPEHPLPILSFVRQSSAANPIGAGPIIVHCSAGVGRTGTYIVLDAMLKQIEAKNELNIRGFLCHIRNQRNFLVQTEEQYIFIHDALLEAIQAGNTNVHCSQLTRYLQLLQSGLPASLLSDKMMGSNSTASTLDTTTTTMTMNSIGGSQEELWLLLDHQFHLVTNFPVQDFHLSSAVKPCNVGKNRNAAVVPVESARVYLTPKPGVDGSDYINATWLQGYQKLKEFIVTQHPLEATVCDFWQMVWDHNSQTVVVLSDAADDDYQIFWPLKQADVEFENFRVRFIDEHRVPLPAVGNLAVPTNPEEYVTQIEVAAQSLQDDYELRVRIFYCPSWPYRGAANPDLAALFRLPRLVVDSHQQYQNGPVVVVDRFGGTEAATLCALTTLMQQLMLEKHADVYMYAKLFHSKRPNVWPSRDDYMFLYRCVEALNRHLPAPPPPATPPPSLHTSFSLPLQLNGYAAGDTVSLTSLPPLCTTPSSATSPTSPNGDVICFRIPPEGMEQDVQIDAV